MFRILLLSVFTFVFTGCHSNTGKHKTTSGQVAAKTENMDSRFPVGKVIRKVKIEGVPDHSYALYLPENYSYDKKWPLFFVFDPHAAGWLPLEKYAPWANRFGFIMAGSNKSKNGLSHGELNQVIAEWFTDCFKRLSIDERRIYTLGFSGGARVAASLAFANPSIRGVVACGGGLSSGSSLDNFRTDFLGFAGREDFNMPELLELDRLLDKTPARHSLILFQGSHEWPDSLTFKDALYWTVFNEMKDNLLPVDQTFIQEFLESNKEKTQVAAGNKDIDEVYRLTKQVIDFLTGLEPVTDFENYLEKLENDPAYKASQVKLKRILEEEKQLKNLYLQSMTTRDIQWWKNEINKLNRKTQTQPAMVKNEYFRVLHFLSLAAYMQSTNSLNNHQMIAAKKFILMYGLIDPENPEADYLSAVLNADNNHPEMALLDLQKAIDKGFNDYTRISNDESFASIRSEEAFNKLLYQIK